MNGLVRPGALRTKRDDAYSASGSWNQPDSGSNCSAPCLSPGQARVSCRPSRGVVTALGTPELGVPRDRQGRVSAEKCDRYQRSEEVPMTGLAGMCVLGGSHAR